MPAASHGAPLASPTSRQRTRQRWGTGADLPAGAVGVGDVQSSRPTGQDRNSPGCPMFGESPTRRLGGWRPATLGICPPFPLSSSGVAGGLAGAMATTAITSWAVSRSTAASGSWRTGWRSSSSSAARMSLSVPALPATPWSHRTTEAAQQGAARATRCTSTGQSGSLRTSDGLQLNPHLAHLPHHLHR